MGRADDERDCAEQKAIAALKKRGGTYGRQATFVDGERTKAKEMVESGMQVRVVCERLKISPPTFYSYFTVKRFKNGRVMVKDKPRN